MGAQPRGRFGFDTYCFVWMVLVYQFDFNVSGLCLRVAAANHKQRIGAIQNKSRVARFSRTWGLSCSYRRSGGIDVVDNKIYGISDNIETCTLAGNWHSSTL